MNQWTVALIILLLASALSAQQTASKPVKNPFNPPAFQNFAASPSSTLRFWLSPEGIRLAKASQHPNLRGMLQRFGVDLGAPQTQSGAITRMAAPVAPVMSLAAIQAPRQVSCGHQTGARFNLQPAAGMPDIRVPAPINNESLDFIPGGGRKGADLVIAGADDFRGILQPGATVDGSFNANPLSWGLSGTGYYVARDGGCGPSFEGGLPHLADPSGQGDLFGLGDPTIAVDATRGNVFESDIRLSLGTTAVGLFRTNASLLNNEASCPSGTHLLNNKEQEITSSNCWPVGLLVGTSDQHRFTVDQPHIRADERPRGAGAGDVYIAWAFFQVQNNFITTISLAACKGNFTSLKDCSDPVSISGSDTGTEFPNVVVRPDGLIAITYVNILQTFDPTFKETDVIQYVVCTPQGAPVPPVCSDPSTIAKESQPTDFTIAGQGFTVSTHPVHDVRSQNGQVEEIVTWAHCKQSPFVPIGNGNFDELGICPDTDVVFATSLTDRGGAPLGWSAPRSVNAALGDQFFPAISSDRSTGTVNIQYYSSQNDPVHHRVQTMVSTLNPGEENISAPKIISRTLNETDADPYIRSGFFGNYIGLASRGGRNYSNFTLNLPIIYGGLNGFGQTNVLTTFKPGPGGDDGE